jgi:CheY-like chemotaxis protein
VVDSPSPVARAVRPSAAKKHVLIVEDDPLNARVLAEFLGSFGYETTVAATGAEAVAKLARLRPDLAIVDVLLPRKNGFEVCFEIKRRSGPRPTPVILMSAAYRDEGEAASLRAALSAEAFLLKPFDLDLLLASVQKLIGAA